MSKYVFIKHRYNITVNVCMKGCKNVANCNFIGVEKLNLNTDTNSNLFIFKMVERSNFISRLYVLFSCCSEGNNYVQCVCVCVCGMEF